MDTVQERKDEKTTEDYKEREQLFLENSRLVSMGEGKRLALYKKSGGRMESMRPVSPEEKDLLLRVRNGHSFYYTIYTYRFSGEEELKEFEERMNTLYETYPLLRSAYRETDEGEYICLTVQKRTPVFSVYDISKRQEKDKRIILRNFLLKERKNLWNPFMKSMFGVNVFQTGVKEYYCAVAMCEQGEMKKWKEKILLTLFRKHEYEHMEQSLREDNVPLFTCANYWKGVLRDIPRHEMFSEQYPNDGIGSELFVLDEELAELLSSFSMQFGIALKELFLTIWGTIFGKCYNYSELVIGDAKEGDVFSVKPICIRQTADTKKLLFDIREQLQNGEKYTGYSIEELKKKQNVDVMKGLEVIQNFNEDSDNKLIMTELPVGKLYQVKPYAIPGVPLQIDYNISSLVMRMGYTYNRRMFDNADIGRFHEVFQKLAKGMLEIIRDKMDASVDEVACQAMQVDTSKLIMRKAAYLRSGRMFTSYGEEELFEVTRKCRVVDYQMGEIISEEQSPADRLYIVAKGRVEVNRTNMEGYLVPVQMLKEGGVFGVACVSGAAFHENQYVAYSETVKLLEIPYTELREEIEMHPSILVDIIEYQQKQLNKFQTLWIMG